MWRDLVRHLRTLAVGLCCVVACAYGKGDSDDNSRFFSVCRPTDAQMVIFGLAILAYEQNRENLGKGRNLLSSGYLYLWNNRNELVIKKLSPSVVTNVFGSAIEVVPHIDANTIVYALVWPDIARWSKYGETAAITRINVGFPTGPGYEVFFNANDVNQDAVEVGCGINLFQYPK